MNTYLCPYLCRIVCSDKLPDDNPNKPKGIFEKLGAKISASLEVRDIFLCCAYQMLVLHLLNSSFGI